MTISLAVPDILVARARAGDLEALEALYRAFETPVYNLALRILRTPEDAEDVLQETFLEVVRSIKQYRGEGHLWGWIKRIAASKALMRIRRNQVRATEELDEESTGGPGATGGVPRQIDLERAIERVSETSRSVASMHEVEGYTHEEIAEQMGKTVSFSKSQLARAHRSEEHTSELQSQSNLVCRLLLEKKKKTQKKHRIRLLTGQSKVKT